MRLCIKIGGAQLEEAPARGALAQAIARAVGAGHEIVVVHGGGNQIRRLTARLGIEDRYHDGLRITDAATAEVVLCVLAGQVNKLLVSSLCAAGVRAVGLCGADGGTFTAKKHRPGGHDLGLVGEVASVDPALVRTLQQGGFVPVLATVAPGEDLDTARDAAFYNINADSAAGPIAQKLGAQALLFLTDVPGVLDGDGARLPTLTPADVERLRARGVIRGGMLPKVQAALDAVAALPGGLVKIAPAAGTDAVLDALEASCGTRFTPDRSEVGTDG